MLNYWGGWGPCCCSTSTQICVTGCSPAVSAYGAVIQVYDSGGTTLQDSCTTDATGCCTFAEAGSHVVKVLVGGVLCHSALHTLSGTTITIALGSPCTGAYICCGGYLIPQALQLTDAVGTISFTYSAALSGSVPTWTGQQTITEANVVTVSNPGAICTYSAPATGPIGVCYTMRCFSASSPKFTMNRGWDYQSVSGTDRYLNYNLGGGAVAACGALSGCVNSNSINGSANPTTTTPFAISFTPTGTPVMPDPIGGGVAVSQ